MLGVSETVVRALDADKVYGVYRFEGITVPVPDAGVTPHVVEAARYAVRNNKLFSKNGDRFWELSGGILFCGECGNRMQTHTTRRGDKAYRYYRCTRSSDYGDCGSYINAGAVEAEVWEAVLRTMDDKEYMLRKAREHFEKRRRELSRLGADAVTLAKRLEAIKTSWVKFQRAYEADAISVADLAARRGELETERGQLERALERAVHRNAELEALSEQEKAVIERIEGSEEDLDDMTPQKRRGLYQDLRVRVEGGIQAPANLGHLPHQTPSVHGRYR